ncbi:ABC transporter permease [Paenibacillus albicereus]|uniref:ABC transporter permease n=1 Tax=Paenibacillus albicereus TaxID=2726185 RepID=A0A6H2GS69_9BACL|nr:ABC transporter permease [Paenibacillus albicereus]QJC50199.1 ABC transporter permease [Paenibacillus albicereus]
MRLSILLPLLAALSFLSLFVGVSPLSPADLLSLTPDQQELLRISRLPRLASLIIAGMSLSIAGLIMQQLSRNKFVSPSTAGTMEAAGLGLLVSLLLFDSAGMLVKMAISFGFALAGTLVFMRMLDRIKFKDAVFIPLVGLMFGGVLASLTTFFAYRYDLIQSIGSWMQGSFTGVMQGRYELLYISVPATLLAYAFASRFTIAGMGEDFALNLGLSYRKIVNLGLVLVALISSSIILTVGVIPFLGLIVPNLVSIFRGDNLKKNLPVTAVFGAVFVLACDILGRVLIHPYELPISLIVGVLGSVIFLYLLLRRDAYAG